MPSSIFPSVTPLGPDVHHARLVDDTRLAALHASGLLDGAAAPVLDRLARLASALLQVPVSLVSLVDDTGQHFPGLSGLGGWAGERRGTPLSHSFCQHVVARDEALIIDDAREHPLVIDNLAIPELGVVAYAGVPLRTAAGHTLGAFCAIDTLPKQWTAAQVQVLEDLAAAAMAEIELRTTVHALLDSHEKLRQQATRDPLTGLLNRRGFADVARQYLALATRTQVAFSVVAMDLDGFKQINDELGHDAGDEALVEISALLSATVRESDCVARMGGDEFVVLLTGADEGHAYAFVDRARRSMSTMNAEPARDYLLAASMGVATWLPYQGATLTQLLHAADVALYADKRARRGASV